MENKRCGVLVDCRFFAINGNTQEGKEMIRVRPSQAGEASRQYLRGGRGIKKIDLYQAAITSDKDSQARELGYVDNRHRQKIEDRLFRLFMESKITQGDYDYFLKRGLK